MNNGKNGDGNITDPRLDKLLRTVKNLLNGVKESREQNGSIKKNIEKQDPCLDELLTTSKELLITVNCLKEELIAEEENSDNEMEELFGTINELSSEINDLKGEIQNERNIECVKEVSDLTIYEILRTVKGLVEEVNVIKEKVINKEEEASNSRIKELKILVNELTVNIYKLKEQFQDTEEIDVEIESVTDPRVEELLNIVKKLAEDICEIKMETCCYEKEIDEDEDPCHIDSLTFMTNELAEEVSDIKEHIGFEETEEVFGKKIEEVLILIKELADDVNEIKEEFLRDKNHKSGDKQENDLLTMIKEIAEDVDEIKSEIIGKEISQEAEIKGEKEDIEKEKDTEKFTAYCFKCRAPVLIVESTYSCTESGRYAIIGKCTQCLSRVSRLLKRSDVPDEYLEENREDINDELDDQEFIKKEIVDDPKLEKLLGIVKNLTSDISELKEEMDSKGQELEEDVSEKKGIVELLDTIYGLKDRIQDKADTIQGEEIIEKVTDFKVEEKLKDKKVFDTKEEIEIEKKDEELIKKSEIKTIKEKSEIKLVKEIFKNEVREETEKDVDENKESEKGETNNSNGMKISLSNEILEEFVESVEKEPVEKELVEKEIDLFEEEEKLDIPPDETDELLRNVLDELKKKYTEKEE